jgi:hypothetical protein
MVVKKKLDVLKLGRWMMDVIALVVRALRSNDYSIWQMQTNWDVCATFLMRACFRTRLCLCRPRTADTVHADI